MFSFVLSSQLGKKIIFWGKSAVLVFLLIYIVQVVRQQSFDWQAVQSQWRSVSHPERWAVGLLLLTPINWGLEAVKWQILLQRITPTTFWEAYQGVLAGVSLGFALPAQLGDTAGRVLSLRGHRSQAIGASLISGGMQFYVALVFGTIAWAYHLRVVPSRDTQAGRGLLIGLIGLSVGGVIFGLIRRRLVNRLSERPALKRLATYWQIAGLYSDRTIGLALLVAGIRYLVFSVQFYGALRLVGIQLPWSVAASGIGLVFLVKTVTPAFNLLSDLGVREAAALWVFAPVSQPVGPIITSVLLTATVTLWLVNILLPVLIGLIWVWKLKLATE